VTGPGLDKVAGVFFRVGGLIVPFAFPFLAG